MRWTKNQTEKWPYYVAIGRRLGLGHIHPRRCALIVIDMQKMATSTAPDQMMGIVGAYHPELRDIYEKRLNEIVWPNLERLVEFFRSKDISIIYTVLGKENVLRLSPREDELVWKKPRTGAFTHSDFDEILKEKGIDTLFFTGVATSHCVGFSCLEALDHGYQVVLIKDATADCRPDHYEAILKIVGLHGYLQTTDRVIADYPWQSWVDSKPPPPANAK